MLAMNPDLLLAITSHTVHKGVSKTRIARIVILLGFLFGPSSFPKLLGEVNIMAKKFDSLLIENMTKNVKHADHKHELRLTFTPHLEAADVKAGFYDYCLRRAADKARKISGQDNDYIPTLEDRAMWRKVQETKVWETDDQFILGAARARVMVQKVKMTNEEMKEVMTTEEIRALLALSMKRDENDDDTDTVEIDTDHDTMANAAG
jgi:hypothetical protein